MFDYVVSFEDADVETLSKVGNDNPKNVMFTTGSLEPITGITFNRKFMSGCDIIDALIQVDAEYHIIKRTADVIRISSEQAVSITK